MGENSSIQWTDHTFNPWIGCQKISPACKHCYAEVSTPARTLRAGGLEVWGPPATTERKRTSRANWLKPLAWNRTAERTGKRIKVFCASLADVFEDHPAVAPWRAELFTLIERTPLLDWQLLSKRPENLREMLPASWLANPRPNVWLGTTVEDQASARDRIPELLATAAVVHFVSCEPLLEAIDLEAVPDAEPCEECGEPVLTNFLDATQSCGCTVEGAEPVACYAVEWVIVGGESGPNARPFNLAWARRLVEQGDRYAKPVFVKQLGLRAQGEWLRGDEPLPRTRRLFDARDADPTKHRFMLEDPHGGDPNEWPEDLRVQEFPTIGGGQ